MKKILLSIGLTVTAWCTHAQVSGCTYSGLLLSSGTAGPVGDDATMDVVMPFSFSFYGNAYTNVQISTNALIWLGTSPGGDGCCSGYLIPSSPDITAPFIALSQTDWWPTSAANGTIYYNTVGTSPNRVFVVHFDSMKHISTTDRLTGEIQLYETTNEVRLVIKTLTGFPAARPSTMGMAAGDGATGLVVSGRNQSTGYTASNECWSLSSSSTILPITLLKFDVKKVGQAAQIDWTTGVEENNAFFTIERSIDGRTYETLSKLNSKGKTSFGHSYTITDLQPNNGKNIYRLVQQDLDGTVTYHGSRTLNFGQANTSVATLIEPNPFTDRLQIKLAAGTPGIVQVSITDVYGREVSRMEEKVGEGGKSLSVPTREWPVGFYSIRVSREGQTEQYKAVKQ